MAFNLVEMAKANYSLSKAEFDKTQAMWIARFGNIPDNDMFEVMMITFDKCKFLPTIADIKESLDEYRQQKRYAPSGELQLDRGKNYDSPMAAKIFDVIAKMDTAKFVAEMVVEKEIVNYARVKFPMISEKLIKDNYLEILQAKEGSEKCFGCVWKFGDCSTNGYFPVMDLQSNGRVHISWTPCQKRRGTA